MSGYKIRVELKNGKTLETSDKRLLESFGAWERPEIKIDPYRIHSLAAVLQDSYPEIRAVTVEKL